MSLFSTRSMVLIIVSLLLTAGNATAQNDRGARDRPHGPRDAESQVARMTAQLNLSDEQSVALLTLLQSTDQERQAIHEQMRSQMEPELCELQLRTESDITSVLDEQQLALFEEQRKERAQNRNGQAGRGRQPLYCSAYELP